MPQPLSHQSHHCWTVLVAAIVFCAAALAAAQTQAADKTHDAAWERGRYLVDDVARCGQCHTPRDSNGNEDRARPLAGGALWLNSAQPVADWPLMAPRIGGVIAASDDDLVRLLTTDIWKDGNRLRAPMPQFRFTPDDAKAVVTYMRTVQPRQY